MILNSHLLMKIKKWRFLKAVKRYNCRNSKMTNMSKLITPAHNFPNLYNQKEFNFIKMINKLKLKLHLFNNLKIKYLNKKNHDYKQMKNLIIVKKFSKKWIFKMKKFQMMI